MRLSSIINQSKHYSSNFDSLIFFIKNWENKNNNHDASNIDVVVSDRLIYLSNNKNAVIQIDKEHLYIDLRDIKTGKRTSKKYQKKEQYINEALSKLFG